MSNVELTFSLPLALGAALMLIHAGIRCKNWLVVRKIKTTSIAKLTGGIAMVRGRVVNGNYELNSPLTGKPCAFFHLQVRDRAVRGNLIVHERRSRLPIFIEDESGRARLELAGARLDFPPSISCSAGFLAKGLSNNVKEYLNKMGVPARFWCLQRDLGCRETHILPGEHIYVLGHCARIGEQLYFHRSGRHPYIITKQRGTIVPKSPVPGWFISASGGLYLLLFVLLMHFN